MVGSAIWGAPPMLGPVRMMKGALPPPSSMSLGTKVHPAPRLSPADGCLSPFALKTCTQRIITRQPSQQRQQGWVPATVAGAASQTDKLSVHCASRPSVHLETWSSESQGDLQRPASDEPQSVHCAMHTAYVSHHRQLHECIQAIHLRWIQHFRLDTAFQASV